MTHLFTPPDTWLGGHFEVSLTFGGMEDDQLQMAFEAIWSHPHVQGVYLDRNMEPENQTCVAASQVDLWTESAQGTMKLPSGLRLPFAILVVRADGEDCLDIGIPMGALDHALGKFGRGFYSTWNVPGASPPAVVREIEDFLAELAASVFAHVKFGVGVIGWETSGTQDTHKIQEQGIPEVRDVGYLLPEGSRLRYYPRTSYPQF